MKPERVRHQPTLAIEKPLPASLADAGVADSIAGQRIGAYTIERELGRGGMSVVYEAKLSERSEQVALKVLNTK